MNLDNLRKDIDAVDDEIVKLVENRMRIAAEIAAYKKENNIPVLNSAREREILNSVASKASPETKSYMRVLYSLMFERIKSSSII